MIRRITEIIDHPERDVISKILCHLDLSLCLDIGAAAGHFTKRLCHLGGKGTRVVAFEPFPANHKYFYESIEGLENDIRLVNKALSDSVGTSSFSIPSVIQGAEPGWEHFTGYSSVGFLSPVSSVRYLKLKLQNLFKLVFRQPRSQLINVKTTTIDKEFPREEIAFVKMDVQGAEEKVLRGASAALEEKRIHALYVEWSGEQGIIDILTGHGYQIYDSTYITVPKVYDIQAFKDIGFTNITEIGLSTGKVAYDMTLAGSPFSPKEVIQQVKSRDLSLWIQTDLIAISPNKQEQFLEAVKKYNERQLS